MRLRVVTRDGFALAAHPTSPLLYFNDHPGGNGTSLTGIISSREDSQANSPPHTSRFHSG